MKRASDQVDFQVKESTKGSHLRGQSEETLQATAHLKTTSNQCHQRANRRGICEASNVQSGGQTGTHGVTPVCLREREREVQSCGVMPQWYSETMAQFIGEWDACWRLVMCIHNHDGTLRRSTLRRSIQGSTWYLERWRSRQAGAWSSG